MHMRDTLKRLVAITEGCRPDMHEPDEQEINAHVVGSRLDNACGDYIGIQQVIGNFQEFVVVLERFDGTSIRKEQFNLATLIALARRAELAPQESGSKASDVSEPVTP